MGNIQQGTIRNCFSTGQVSGSGGSHGGLVGSAYSGKIENSHATGTVSGGNHDNIGGLVGGNLNASLDINNCYATGTVSECGWVQWV